MAFSPETPPPGPSRRREPADLAPGAAGSSGPCWYSFGPDPNNPRTTKPQICREKEGAPGRIRTCDLRIRSGRFAGLCGFTRSSLHPLSSCELLTLLLSSRRASGLDLDGALCSYSVVVRARMNASHVASSTAPRATRAPTGAGREVRGFAAAAGRSGSTSEGHVRLGCADRRRRAIWLLVLPPLTLLDSGASAHNEHKSAMHHSRPVARVGLTGSKVRGAVPIVPRVCAADDRSVSIMGAGNAPGAGLECTRMPGAITT